jgi:hypothetical protein
MTNKYILTDIYKLYLIEQFLDNKTALLDVKEKNKYLFFLVLKLPLFASLINAHPAKDE